MAPVTLQLRDMTADDFEQVTEVESRAFYNTPTPERVELGRQLLPVEWTVVAEVDGKIVATVRTQPQARRFHGAQMRFGAVGPVACLAPYRRRGIVGQLLTFALGRMRERGQVLSGLHTPHDALYRRYGWERAEGKQSYSFEPKRVTLRFRPSGGRTEPAGPDDWERLDRLFQARWEQANGPFVRRELWWKYAVLGRFDDGKLKLHDIVVWVDDEGRDQGYAVYVNRNMAPRGQWTPQEVWIRDFVALNSDAYLGLWQHMKTHDLAEKISGEFHPADPFRFVCDDPFAVSVHEPDGAMLRVVDVEAAFAQRPFVGARPASFTARIADPTLDWNDGTWRIEGGEGGMSAKRTDDAPDAEFDVNALAALFTGFMGPRVAVDTGFARLHRPEALAEMEQAFAVLDAPYCPDYF